VFLSKARLSGRSYIVGIVMFKAIAIALGGLVAALALLCAACSSPAPSGGGTTTSTAARATVPSTAPPTGSTSAGAQTLAWATGAFCMLRGIPVLLEGWHYFQSKLPANVGATREPASQTNRGAA